MKDRTTRTWRLFNLEQGIAESDADLRRRACEKLGIAPERLAGFRIARRSLDARRKRGILRFVCHVDLELLPGRDPSSLRKAERSGRVKPAPVECSLRPERVHPSLKDARVAVVGSGPAGIFAALVYALAGLRVDVFERGSRLDGRGSRLVAFHRSRKPDPECNLLFGEGGAGTYSDGKLYTRVDDELEIPLLRELVEAGAPADILYDSRAHIGTDHLHTVLPRLRARLESLGVTFHWNTRVESLGLTEAPHGRRVAHLATSRGEVPCDALLLALGHSARDTWNTLAEQGVQFEAKPFQLGLRVEHPQDLITSGRYGTGPEAQQLGAASYNLLCKAGDGLPSAFSFCMCPGGKIVASVNEAGLLCTNGMSNSGHSSPWANAGIVTTFGPQDYAAYGTGPFAGVAFQRAMEQSFFAAGGSDYSVPAQRVPDFIAGRPTPDSDPLRTSYVLGARPGRLDLLLPARGRTALVRALERFESMLPGFSGPEGLLVGVESRSSGPVRCPRVEGTRRALGFQNLYPVGEGAGYAGGIMSAAIDGARSAQALLHHGLH